MANKILNVAYFCITIERGGLERLLLQICSEFIENYSDIKPVVIVFRKTESDLTNDFIKAGIKLSFLDINESNFNYKNFLTILNWLKISKPDIVHTHSSYKMDMFILLAASIAGINKRYCTIHNMDQRKSLKPFISYRISSILSTKIIAVSQSAKDFYEKNRFYGSNKMIVIYNCSGFKVNKVEPRSRGLSINNTIKLVNIGSLRIQKGQIFLIKALKILEESGLKFTLDLYGADRFDYGEIIFNEISKLNLSMVNYKGETDQVENVLLNSDILVASSIREAMPLVVLEALSAGIPIVATDILPHREILDPISSKILIEPANEKTIAEGILKIVQNENLYITFSKEALNRSSDFSLKKTVEMHYNLYTAI